MEIIEEFCEETGMELNIGKTFASSIKYLQNGKMIKGEGKINFSGNEIKMIGPEEVFRYLGAQRSLTLDWKDEENRLKSTLPSSST